MRCFRSGPAAGCPHRFAPLRRPRPQPPSPDQRARERRSPDPLISAPGNAAARQRASRGRLALAWRGVLPQPSIGVSSQGTVYVRRRFLEGRARGGDHLAPGPCHHRAEEPGGARVRAASSPLPARLPLQRFKELSTSVDVSLRAALEGVITSPPGPVITAPSRPVARGSAPHPPLYPPAFLSSALRNCLRP